MGSVFGAFSLNNSSATLDNIYEVFWSILFFSLVVIDSAVDAFLIERTASTILLTYSTTGDS